MNILRAPSQIKILKPLLSWTKTSPCEIDWGTIERSLDSTRSLSGQHQRGKREKESWTDKRQIEKKKKKSMDGGKNLAAQRYKPSWKKKLKEKGIKGIDDVAVSSIFLYAGN